MIVFVYFSTRYLYSCSDLNIWLANQGIMSSMANNFVNFQLVFTNELSKSKLKFFLSSEIQHDDSTDLRVELFSSKLVHIFWDTLCLDKNTDQHKYD